jgi:hypothetical protein
MLYARETISVFTSQGELLSAPGQSTFTEKGIVFDEDLITAAIEESAIIPIGVFIPKEFSEAYKE